MKSRLTEAQQALVARYVGLVQRLAIAYRTDRTTEDELVSAGYEALCQVALRYREAEGPFEPFAKIAIKGAMLRALFKEARSRRALSRLVESPGPQLSGPKEASLDEAMALQPGDDAADVVEGLERVAAGFLAVYSLRASQGDESILLRERERQIARALDATDPKDREAFVAHVVLGKTHEQCRHELGLKQRTMQRMIERVEDAVRAGVGAG